MRRNSLWAVALLLCSVLFLSSCANNDEVVSNQETIPVSNLAISDPLVKKEIEFMREKKIITESLYQKWLKSPREAVLDETDILVDEKGTKERSQSYRIYTPLSNDMMAKGMMTDIEGIDRKKIQDLMKEYPSSPSARMKRDLNMFDSAGGTITCRVFTQSGNGCTALTQDWKTALVAAVAKWNSQGLKVKFKVVDATNTNIVGGYVNVYMQDLFDPAAYAKAELPSSPGYFGTMLKINAVPLNFADVNGKVTALVHELGHIVGFRHTELAANSSQLIFNTAVTCNESNDANSFMYGYMSYNKVFSDFSSCDKQNLKYYWGY